MHDTLQEKVSQKFPECSESDTGTELIGQESFLSARGGCDPGQAWQQMSPVLSFLRACGPRGPHRACPGAGAPSGRPGAGSGRCPVGACGGHRDRKGDAPQTPSSQLPRCLGSNNLHEGQPGTPGYNCFHPPDSPSSCLPVLTLAALLGRKGPVSSSEGEELRT